MIWPSSAPAASRALTTTLVAGMWLVSACGASQSPFARASSDAASTLSASVTTLRLEHEGRLTRAYAAASFLNYRDALQGLDSELRSSEGAPGRDVVEQLVVLYRMADGALSEPCLDEGCDWRSQAEVLDRAKEAFQKAGEA